MAAESKEQNGNFWGRLMRVWLAALIAASGLGGCVTQPDLVGISVESSARSAFNAAKVYEVAYGTEAQSAEPEARALVLATGRMLQASGLAVSPLTTSAKADVRVTVAYHIGPPALFSYTYDEPVYVRHRRAVTTETRIDKDGRRTTTTTSTPRAEMAGFRPVKEQAYRYPSALELVATPTKGRATPIWSVNVSVDELAYDARHYLYLLRAAQSFIGASTRDKAIVRLKRDDPGVAFLRTGRGLPKRPRPAPAN